MKYFYLVTMFVIGCISATQAQTWQPLGDDDFNQPSYYTARYTCMAMAPDGTPYIGFSDNKNGDKATVRKFSGGTWQYVGSPGFSANEATYISLKIAPDGTPYIGYTDGSRATVKKWDGTVWVDVGAAGLSAQGASFISLAIASDGTPYIGYSGTGSKATVRKWNGTAWVDVGTQGFSSGVAYYTSLALAPDGTPYLGYQDIANGNKAAVKKFDGSAWVDVGTPGFSGASASNINLVTAPDGTLYIGYVDFNGFSYGRATVKKYDGSAWVNVGTLGFSTGSIKFPSLAIAADGTPYMAYDETNVTVKKFNGTAWVNVGMPKFSGHSGKYGQYVSLVIAPNGTPYAGYMYYGGAYSADKAAVQQFDGAAWHPTGDDGGMEGIEGGSLDLATAPDGTVYLACHDIVSDRGVVKKWTGTNWERVGGVPPFVANDIELAFAPDGTPYAVIGAASGFFTFRYDRITDTWEQVGPGKSNYNQTALTIAIAPDNTIYVSEGANTWRYDKDSNTWVNILTLSGPGVVIYYSDMAVAADGTLYLTYTRVGSVAVGRATVRKWDGAIWQFVGDSLVSDAYASQNNIRIAPDGTLYLCYQDVDILTLGYGSGKATVKKFNGTAWENVGLPRFTPDHAFNVSLAIAPDGTPYVGFGEGPSFYNWYAGRKASVMKFDGAAWVDAGNAGLSAGAATVTRLTITGDGSRAVIVYNDGNIFAKYLDIGGAVLPIHLVDFTAKLVNGSTARLQWTGNEDEHSSHYNIQRSYDGRHFTSIGTVTAKGISSASYTYDDTAAFAAATNAGKVFYKLQMTDKDGSSIYSTTVSLRAGASIGTAGIYPNPATDYIIIKTNNARYLRTQACIIDNAGRVLQTLLLNTNNQSVDVSRLATGVYYLKLSDGVVLKFAK